MKNSTKLLSALVLGTTLFTALNSFADINSCQDLIKSHKSYSSTASGGTHLYFNNTAIRSLPETTLFTLHNAGGSEVDTVQISPSCTDDQNHISFTSPQVLYKNKFYPLSSSTLNGIFMPSSSTIYTSNVVKYSTSVNTGVVNPITKKPIMKDFSFTIPVTTFS
jgi:hypothetical protein